MLTRTMSKLAQPTYYVPYTYFVIVGPGTSNTTSWIFKCTRCVNSKTISTCAKSRYNLRQHVKAKHAADLKEFDELCSAFDKRKRSVAATESNAESVGVSTTASSHSATNSMQSTLKRRSSRRRVRSTRFNQQDFDFSACTDANLVQPTLKQHFTFSRNGTGTFLSSQQAFDSAILEYLIASMMPFRHVTSDAFKSLMNKAAPGFIVKTKKAYQSMADSLFNSKKNALVLELNNAKYVCLTADHWHSHRKGYLCVTAHWFKSGQKHERKHACLALRPVLGSVTYSVLAETMQSIIEEYGLNGKITHCVTDSGSNFVEAFHEFGSSDVSANNSSASPMLAEESDEEDFSSEEPLIPTPLSKVIQGGFESEIFNTYSLPKHFKCAAHRLTLVASHDSRPSLENPICKHIYQSLTAKLQAIWNKQHRSVLISDKIQSMLNGLFLVPDSTRWNSYFDAMARVQQLYQASEDQMNSLFQFLELRPITGEEAIFLKEFLTVMRPLAEGLDILQSDHTVSAGHLIPTITCILQEWDAMVDLKYTSELVGQLSAALQRRFQADLSDKNFVVAASLHPCFKLNWVPENGNFDEVRSTVRAAFKEHEFTNTTAQTEGTHAVEVPPAKKPLYWRIIERSKALKGNPVTSSYAIWEQWITSKNKTIPLALLDIFKKFNTTIPSSARIEQLFSIGDLVMKDTRILLSDKNFEMLVFLGANQDHLFLTQ